GVGSLPLDGRRELENSLDRVGVAGKPVVSVALDAREPERHTARIVRAALDVVERHLDHELRADVDDVPFAMRLPCEELPRLPFEDLVGHSLERLAEHDETTVRGIPGAEVNVAEPTLASAGSPFHGEDDEVEPAGGLDLEPRRP